MDIISASRNNATGTYFIYSFAQYNESDRHHSLDGGIGIIVNEGEVLVLEVKDILYVWIQNHPGQRTGLTTELQMDLLHVVGVDVRITRGMDELTRLQTADLRHHHREEGV